MRSPLSVLLLCMKVHRLSCGNENKLFLMKKHKVTSSLTLFMRYNPSPFNTTTIITSLLVLGKAYLHHSLKWCLETRNIKHVKNEHTQFLWHQWVWWCCRSHSVLGSKTTGHLCRLPTSQGQSDVGFQVCSFSQKEVMKQLPAMLLQGQTWFLQTAWLK